MDDDALKREKALYNFWSSFGLPAYDETSVPDTAEMPYITYETKTAAFDTPIPLSMSIWYYSHFWDKITEKAIEIINTIGYGGKLIKYDGGAIWITIPNQNYDRMSDSASDLVRRIVINVMAEFIN